MVGNLNEWGDDFFLNFKKGLFKDIANIEELQKHMNRQFIVQQMPKMLFQCGCLPEVNILP